MYAFTVKIYEFIYRNWPFEKNCGLGKLPALKDALKGLSHEIDFKNFDKKLHNLACLTKSRGWFLNFLEAPMIL